MHVMEADVSCWCLENVTWAEKPWLVTNAAFCPKPLSREKKKENELCYFFF